MNEEQFRRSYRAETALAGTGQAPGMEIRTPGGNVRIPVKIVAIMMSAYRNANGQNPLLEASSAHEITLGVVCNDDELETVQMITLQHAGRTAADGHTTPQRVATALEMLASVCGQPGLEGSLFYVIGANTVLRYGDRACDLAVEQVGRNIDRIATEHGDQYQGVLRDIAARSLQVSG